jgi:hypothetical protein
MHVEEGNIFHVFFWHSFALVPSGLGNVSHCLITNAVPTFEASSRTLLFATHFIRKAIRFLWVGFHSIRVLSDANANLHMQPWLQS